MEIGYWLRKSRWGSGYMIEATNAVSDFAMNMLKANRVEIRCDAAERPQCPRRRACGLRA